MAALIRSDAQEAVLGRPQFNLDMMHALDSQGVSNELLVIWSQREDTSLRVFRDSVNGGLSLLIRDGCLQFMHHLTIELGLNAKVRFSAVGLLDLYCLRRPPGIDLEHIPSLCVAIVHVLKKMESLRFEGNAFSYYSSRSQELAQWLRNHGHNASEGSAETISMQEQQLLQVLGWRVTLPSIESWLSMFCARFNLFTGGVFVQSVNWVWQRSLSHAKWLVRQQACCAAVPSSRLARGLVSLMLVFARLLPVGLLRPSQVPSAAWELLLAESHPEGTLPEPQCALPTTVAEKCLQALEIAMGVDRGFLQNDCEFVATLSREMLRDFAQGGQHESVAGIPDIMRPTSADALRSSAGARRMADTVDSIIQRFQWEPAVQDVIWESQEPVAEIPEKIASDNVRLQWESFVEKTDLNDLYVDDDACDNDIDPLSDSMSVSEVDEEASQPDAIVGEPTRSGEPILLITYTRVNRRFFKALHQGHELEVIRALMSQEGFSCRLGVSGDGASIFVHPCEYQHVLIMIQHFQLDSHHVIVSNYLKPLVDDALLASRVKKAANVKERLVERIGHIAYSSFVLRTEKTFFAVAQPREALSDAVTVSTTDVRGLTNPRKAERLCETHWWIDDHHPCEDHHTCRKQRQDQTSIECCLSLCTRSAVSCNTSVPDEDACERAQAKSVIELHQESSAISNALHEEGNRYPSTMLGSTLCFFFNFVKDADGPCMIAVIPAELKHVFDCRSVDGGYMKGRIAGKNIFKQLETVRSSLVEFTAKPDEKELGYKPDCWSMRHADEAARGQPKDGLICASFNGTILFAAVQSYHRAVGWHMTGGTRHQAAIGIAEWLSLQGQGGVVFVRSEAGTVRVLIANIFAQRGQMFMLL